MGNMAYQIHHIIPIDIFNYYKNDLRRIMRTDKTENIIQSYNNRIALFTHIEPANALRNLYAAGLLEGVPLGSAMHNSYHEHYNQAVSKVINDIVNNGLDDPQKRTMLIDMQFTLREMLQAGVPPLSASKEVILDYLEKKMLSVQDIKDGNERYRTALERETLYDANHHQYAEVLQDAVTIGADEQGRPKFTGADNKKFVIHTGADVAQKLLDIDNNRMFKGFLGDEESRKPLMEIVNGAWKSNDEQKKNNQVRGAIGAAVYKFKEKFPYISESGGFYVYKLYSDANVSVISAMDSKSRIMVNNEYLPSLEFVGTPMPFSPSMNVHWAPFRTRDGQYQFLKYDDNQWEFAAKNASGNYQPLARIRDWKEGDFGFTLKHNPDSNTGLDPSAFNPYDAGKPAYYYYNAASSPERVHIHGSDTHSSQFNGSPYDDIFYTGNGVLHYVMGAGGNDYIAGGDGREYIMAGMHNKDKPLQNDEDTVFAGGNSDIVTGGDGNDQLHADDGSDNYEKPLPDESIQTEDEKRGDWISGQYGSDTITGSAKKDVLAGGEGDDTIRAGAGDDLVLGDANYVPSGMYKNISYTEKTIEIRWLSNGNTEEFQDTEVSVPSDAAFKWTWSHDDKDFSVKPGKGARMVATDRVQGAGNDTLHGGAGNDWMAGQAGHDEMHGDDGDDTIFGDDAVPIPEGFASGDDRLYAGKGKDKLHGGAGNDVLDASDDDNDKDELSGDEGDDQLNGGTGGDELNGGAGNDELRAGKDKTLMDGGSGNDTYFSNSGDDTMTDQDGDDHYYLSPGTDDIKDFGMGHDGYHISFAHLMPPGVTTIHDSNGKGFITYNGRAITNDGVRAVAENEWVTDTGAKLTREGSDLVMTNGPQGSQGKVIFTGFFDSEEFLGLKLPSFNDEKNIDPKPNPEPSKPEQPKAPTAGKPLAAQSIHEKDKLSYTLAEDTFHTANKDDKLSWSARLADGKPLPKWLNFDAATRTFSGTPGNDDVGVLDIEISVQGKGGSASQHFALNVINVNDAPYISAPFSLHSTNSDGEVKCDSQLYIQDIDKDDKLTFSAEMSDGQPLPSWLSIDSETGVLTGILPVREGKDYFVRITATDKAGASASDVLMIRGAFPKIGLIGSNKDDVLKGMVRSAYGVNIEIHGYGGNDTIVGGNLHDDLYGDKGNDVLDGGSGNDIYHFARGDGNDIINNHDTGARRHDSIDFSDMNRSDFDIRREGNNLVLRSKDGKDQITVTNHFLSGWQIDSIRFADGITLDYNAINTLVSTQNPPQGNYTNPAAQALQMNQAIASLNSQAQPLDALATPDLQPRPLLAAGNP